ncbi:hypothetical protein FALBO_1120 [Fusarium albosuccineum]|uniref:Reticulon domain-containing protein n=1 Tax=Fusarium albosuccineum TaxID=1237068 RepID=A0A8H4LQ53_9HYPO|nr:hypothetical protein FALBO_1120 [Fusarium albosuccineum]
MSGPSYVGMPVQGEGAQQSALNMDKIPSAMPQSMHNNINGTHVERLPGQEAHGPLRQIIDHQDSLYKYISWDDPARTLGAYFGALSVLFLAHYLPLSQVALKTGAITLGVISITEYASRAFGPNTVLSRLRPREYKQVPEQTLNATLKDIHDLIQYTVVQAQKILFGQDLNKTFATFICVTILYWLVNVLTPFLLGVLGLTAIFASPLITSPRGREVARDAQALAGDVATAAGEKASTVAQDARTKAADLSSNVRDTAANLAGQNRNNASGISQTTADDARNLPNTGANAAHNVARAGVSALDNARQYVNDSLPDAVGGGAQRDDSSDTSESSQEAGGSYQLSGSRAGPTGQATLDDVPDAAISAGNQVPPIFNSAVDSSSRRAPNIPIVNTGL